MRNNVEIKTWSLKDLVGKQLKIEKYGNDDGTIIVAIDTDSGELFVLGQEIIPEIEPKRHDPALG